MQNAMNALSLFVKIISVKKDPEKIPMFSLNIKLLIF